MAAPTPTTANMEIGLKDLDGAGRKEVDRHVRREGPFRIGGGDRTQSTEGVNKHGDRSQSGHAVGSRRVAGDGHPSADITREVLFGFKSQKTHCVSRWRVGRTRVGGNIVGRHEG